MIRNSEHKRLTDKSADIEMPYVRFIDIVENNAESVFVDPVRV